MNHLLAFFQRRLERHENRAPWNNEISIDGLIGREGLVIKRIIALEESMAHSSVQINFQDQIAQTSKLEAFKQEFAVVHERIASLRNRLDQRSQQCLFQKSLRTKAEISSLAKSLARVERDIQEFGDHTIGKSALQCARCFVQSGLVPFLHYAHSVPRMIKRVLWPRIGVLPNPIWVFPDFTSPIGGNEPLTAEGIVRRAILQHAVQDSIFSNSGTVIEVWGEQGTGKSCALRAQACDHGIRARFYRSDNAGCIRQLEYRQNFTENDIIEQLSLWVREAGDEDMSNAIRKQKDITKAVDFVVAYFEGKDCLFLFPDDWESTPNWEDITEALSNLRRCSAATVVVFAVRAKRLKEAQVRIHLKSGTFSLQSKRIFRQASGVTKREEIQADCRDLVREVLRFCRGNGLLLQHYGNGIKLHREVFQKSLRETLEDYKLRYARVQEKVGGDADNNLVRFQVMIVLEAGLLKDCSAQKPVPYFFRLVETYFQSFCTIEDGEWVAYKWLWRYWGLLSEQDAMRMGRFMEYGHVGYHEIAIVDGSALAGFRSYKHGLSYLQDKARKEKKYDRWMERKRKYIPKDVKIKRVACPTKRPSSWYDC